MTNIIHFPTMNDAETAPGVHPYWPELKEQQPDCQIEARLGYYGTHYYVDTPLELKGRGITEVAASWIPGCRKQVENWRSYRVTKRAFEILKGKYSISMECLLD